MPTLRLVASTKNVLEILATVPEADAISKKASGEESPSPNLPREVEAKMAKILSELLWNSTSLEKEAPALKSQNPVTDSDSDNEAGPPAPQSSFTYEAEAD